MSLETQPNPLQPQDPLSDLISQYAIQDKELTVLRAGHVAEIARIDQERTQKKAEHEASIKTAMDSYLKQIGCNSPILLMTVYEGDPEYESMIFYDPTKEDLRVGYNSDEADYIQNSRDLGNDFYIKTDNGVNKPGVWEKYGPQIIAKANSQIFGEQH